MTTANSNRLVSVKPSASRVATCIAIAVLASVVFAGCMLKLPSLENKNAFKDASSGCINIDVSTDDFNDLGFSFGDSVNVEFSNGYVLEGIPYYSDYYSRSGEPSLVGLPGHPYVQVSAGNYDSLWDAAGLVKGDTANVTLAKSGDFSGVQNAFSATFSNERHDYLSDASFANYRELSGGRLKHHTFYRASSAFDDELNRAGYVNALMRKDGIAFILNLSDNNDEITEFLAVAKAKGTDVSYAESLLADGNVAAIDLDGNYMSEEFAMKLASGLVELSAHEGPYLTHCIYGRDRTGFVCMLLEALAGATYDEMRDDYMMSYANFYGFTSANSPNEFKAITEARFDEMVAFLAALSQMESGVNLQSINYKPLAQNYLRAAGMTDSQIDALTVRICEQ